MYQKSILVGRCTKEGELKYIQGSGMAVYENSIAIDRGYGDKKQTDFFNFKLFGKTAENTSNFIGKGSLVMLEGGFQNRSWDKQDGTKGYATDFVGNLIKFLDSKKNGTSNGESGHMFEPSFTPQGLDPQGFQAIDDDDIPF